MTQIMAQITTRVELRTEARTQATITSHTADKIGTTGQRLKRNSDIESARRTQSSLGFHAIRKATLSIKLHEGAPRGKCRSVFLVTVGP
ncbi:hypothetical protein WN48_03882 [Eufriesea mexicana]|nr:hypothetical protein WN48_03882 [Eufriesea mexicana]